MATDKKFVVKNGLQAQNIDFVDSTTATPTATLTASMSAAGVLSFDSGTLEIDGANNTVNIPLLGSTLGTNGNLIQFGDSTSDTDDRLQFGANQDLQIYHDSSHSYIVDSGTGELRLKSTGGGIHFQDGSGNDVFEVFLTGQTHLHNNATRMLSTITTGIEINGSDIVFEGATADANETTLTVTDPTADRTITLPDATGTVLTTGNLTEITNLGVLTGDIVFEGATDDAFETTLTVTDPTADRTITLPNTDGTVAVISSNGFLSGWNNGSSSGATLIGGSLQIQVGSGYVASYDNPAIKSSSGTDLLVRSSIRQNFTDNLTLEAGGNVTLNGYGTSGTGQGQVISKSDHLFEKDIIFEGATADAFETTVTVTDPTADRTITLPDATGTVALTSDIPSLSGYLQNVVEDTTPQLGGGLDLNGNDITGTGNISITGNFTSSLAGTPEMLIQSTAGSSQDAKLRIRGSRTTSISGDIAQIIFETNDTSTGTLSDVLASITAGKDTASTNQGQILFSTTDTNGGSPSEKLRIKSTGYTLLQGVGESSAQENTHLRVNDLTSWAQGVGGTLQLSGKHGSDGVNYVFGTIKGIKENATDNNHNGALTFSTRSQGVSPTTEQMRIDSSGNVGINNTAPSALLEVGNGTDHTLGSTQGNTLDTLHLTYDTANTDRLVFSTQRTATGTTWVEARHRIQRRVDSTNMGYIEFGGTASGNDNTTIAFGEASTERVVIDGDGNVGIGTSGPLTNLHIRESGASTTNATKVMLTLDHSPSTTPAAGFGSEIEFRGKNPASGTSVFGSIAAVWEGTTTDPSGGTLQFKTDGYSGGNTTRMTIDSSGNVGIGTTSPIYAADIKTSGTNNGQLRVGGASTSATGLLFEQTNSGTTTANIQNSYYSTSASASLSIKSGYTTFHTGTSGSERMRISSGGVLSVGNTSPKTWHSNSTGVIQFGGVGALENYNTTDDPVIWSANQYRASDGNFKYIENNEASRISQYAGEFYFQTAPTGTADTNATFTTHLKINNGGNVGIGTDSPVVPLNIEAAGSSSAGENTHLRINDTTNMAAGVGGVIQLSGEADSGGTTQYTFATIKGIKENGTTGNYDGALTFATRANGVSPAAEHMRIDSSGNVGIGTTNPSEKLHVFKANGGGDVAIRVTNNATTAGTTSSIRFTNTTSTYDHGAVVAGRTPQSYIALETQDGVEGLRVISSGSQPLVGIGDSAPSSTLEISNSDQTNGTTLTITNAFSGNSWAVDDVIGAIDFKTDDASTSQLVRGQIQSITDDVTGTNWSYGTALTFSTAFNNTLSEAMRISSGGNVGIGTTSPTANGLTLNSSVSGASGMQFHIGGSATAPSAGSYGTLSNNNHGDILLATNAYINTNRNPVVINTHGSMGPTGIQLGGNGGHDIRFYVQQASSTAGTEITNAERMRINSSGYVGIGVDPSKKLHVGAGSVLIDNFSGSVGHMTINNATNNINNDYIRANIMMTRNEDQVVWNPSTNVWDFAGGSSTDWSMIAHHSASLRFYTGATQSGATTKDMATFKTDHLAMTVKTDGNVGIGTDSPGYTLDVRGNIGTTGNIVFEGATADANETTLAVTDPSADRTITLPDATGTVVLDSTEAATIYSYMQIFG